MDETALNYAPVATVHVRGCRYARRGCTDRRAANYDALATEEDGSCVARRVGCLLVQVRRVEAQGPTRAPRPAHVLLTPAHAPLTHHARDAPLT